MKRTEGRGRNVHAGLERGPQRRNVREKREKHKRQPGPWWGRGWEEGCWNEVRDIVQQTGIKTIHMEKKCRKAKWLSGEALQRSVKKREAKSKGEKERYKHQNAEFQRIARGDKKAFFSE